MGTNRAYGAPGDKTPTGAYVPLSEKGVASGVATLDANSKIPSAQLPSLSATYVGKGSLVLNVKDYGATGDGVTDDRLAVKSAIDIANVAGGTVYFPPGEYFISTWSLFANTGDTKFNRWAFTVKSNVKILAAAGVLLTEKIWYDNRRVMFYLEGSNITIDGLTFRNDYDMAGGSRPTSIPIGAGDSFNADSIVPVNDIRIQNCTFLRPWHPTKFAFHQTTGTATAENITITNCVSHGEIRSSSSGGYNFRSGAPGRIKNVTVTGNQCYDVTVSAAIGYYGVQDGVISGNVLRGSMVDGAGIQLENGADNITVTGNTTVDHFNHIWVDDSANVAISGNVCRNNASGSNNRGVRITKQGFAEDVNKLTTDISVIGNVLKNCYITAEPFGAPAGKASFGSFTISGNTVGLDGVTNNYGISLAGGIAANVSSNRVIGALLSSIYVAPIINQYLVIEGNITTKQAAEASVGLTISNTSAFRPIVANNQFINSISIPYAVSMMVGNVRVFSSAGAPEAAVSAPVGSLFLRTDGGTKTSLYVKETGQGPTGWVVK